MRRSSFLLLFALACPWALADGPRAGNLELGPAWSRASTWDATAREVYWTSTTGAAMATG